MSRHHKHRSADGAPARIASLKAMQATLAAEFGLSADDARIGQAALVKLNQENWQGQILLGRPVPACELKRIRPRSLACLASRRPISISSLSKASSVPSVKPTPRQRQNRQGEGSGEAEAKAALEAAAPPAPAENVVPLRSATPAPAPPPKRPAHAPAIDLETGQPRTGLLNGNSLADLVSEVTRPGSGRAPPTGWDDWR